MSRNQNRQLVLFAIKHPYQAAVRILALPLIAIAIVGAAFYGHYQQSDNGPYEKRPDTSKEDTDRALALYTLWLTGFTGALAVSTIGLWWTTKRGMRDQSRDMSRSLKINAIAADAAIKSANAAEAALSGAETPFLFPLFEARDAVPNAMVEQLLLERPEHVVEIQAGNYGRSPAVIHLVNVSSSLEIPVARPLTPRRGLRVDAIIGPNERVPIINIGISNIAKDRVHFIEGFVIYSDLFGDFYATRLCYNYLPAVRSFYAIGGVARNKREKLSREDQDAIIAAMGL